MNVKNIELDEFSKNTWVPYLILFDDGVVPYFMLIRIVFIGSSQHAHCGTWPPL